MCEVEDEDEAEDEGVRRDAKPVGCSFLLRHQMKQRIKQTLNAKLYHTVCGVCLIKDVVSDEMCRSTL